MLFWVQKSCRSYPAAASQSADGPELLAVQPFPQGKNIKLSPHVTHLSGHLNVHQPGISVCRFCKIMENIYSSTDEAGFRVLTWYNAGTRNIYATTPIETPEDLEGLKIRVQQSPASVSMIEAFGAAASPMSFGEVYTAIQQGVIDGAENNELALTNNKHGEVAKYYTYTMHQMVPDMLIGNLKFLEGLSDEEYEIFQEAARISTEVEMEEWDAQVEEAKDIAQNDMGVEFIDVDIDSFKAKVEALHEEMLAENADIVDLYDHIQEINEQYADEGGEHNFSESQ